MMRVLAWLPPAAAAVVLCLAIPSVLGGPFSTPTTGPHSTLLEAVRSCTHDQEGLVVLLHRFAQQNPGVEDSLLAFLRREATELGGLVQVEGALDWVLALCVPGAGPARHGLHARPNNFARMSAPGHPLSPPARLSLCRTPRATRTLPVLWSSAPMPASAAATSPAKTPWLAR